MQTNVDEAMLHYVAIILGRGEALVPTEYMGAVKEALRDYHETVLPATDVFNDLGARIGRLIRIERATK